VRRFILGIVLASGIPATFGASPVPAAIYTDPPRDAQHPATMLVLHIPVGGVEINGVAYVAAGAGPHPLLLICHGLPGNEKNLDLAQAARRAGWTAVTFNYRGSWGSPGTFSFSGNLVDAAAVLAYLREPTNAARLRADPARIVLFGHSMGGWVAAKTAERDRGLSGVILASAADLSLAGGMPHADLVAMTADNMESLAGVSAESMAEELAANRTAYALRAEAAALARTPLLVLTSDDGLAPEANALVAAVRGAGGTHVASAHVATDHAWSDRRIELESRVLRWLARLGESR
jgi:pimeloyl-ACP methyl ester carboxylesterase